MRAESTYRKAAPKKLYGSSISLGTGFARSIRSILSLLCQGSKAAIHNACILGRFEIALSHSCTLQLEGYQLGECEPVHTSGTHYAGFALLHAGTTLVYHLQECHPKLPNSPNDIQSLHMGLFVTGRDS